MPFENSVIDSFSVVEEDRSNGLGGGGGQISSSANSVRPSQALDANAANNAAFMALRANPETTIRPLSSGLGSPEMPSNDLQGAGGAGGAGMPLGGGGGGGGIPPVVVVALSC